MTRAMAISSATVSSAAHGQLHLDLDPPKSMQTVISLAIARAQGHDAMDRAEAKAKAIDPQFIERAAAHMLAYLRAHGPSSGEMLTDSCKLAGIRSTDDRHFGPVFRTLIRRGPIKWCGDARRVKGHGSRGGSLYVLVAAL